MNLFGLWHNTHLCPKCDCIIVGEVASCKCEDIHGHNENICLYGNFSFKQMCCAYLKYQIWWDKKHGKV